ncbi:MAG TPA: efflux transporter outer membrane subunit [Candidatus Aquilonibacter sp.]|nr:efflux transporter outer membrane subunit [Candidatus Aquilonibacter sp.]
MKVVRVAVGLSLAALLAGCSVGPRYARPAVETPTAYKEAPPQSFEQAGIWKPAQPADQEHRGKWWEAFGDPQLNALEEQVTVSNQDLKSAESRFQQARALVRFNRASEFPTIEVGPSASYVKDSNNTPAFPTPVSRGGANDFVLPFDLSYEIDLWGRIRHGVAAAREEAQASAADVATASLSLHAELAIDYFELRNADTQKQILDNTVRAYTDAYQLTETRFEGGASPRSDVAQAKTQLDDARVEATDVTVERAAYEHAIAVLIGKPPAEFGLAPDPLNLAAPVIPASMPSELLERRPDIAAAERRVAEANEQIGIARAAYYPTLSLNGTAGYESTHLSDLLDGPSALWAVGPQLVETLFDAGRRHATSQAAWANFDALTANYRQTALTAFQEVEDNLAALRILEQEAQQQHEATASADDWLVVSTNRYKGGVDNYLQVIIAQTTDLSNQRNEADILRRRMDASVLLIKALGGGWDASQLPAQASLR